MPCDAHQLVAAPCACQARKFGIGQSRKNLKRTRGIRPIQAGKEI
jgi:hypothetical protein